MNYEKKYKDALKRAKNLHKDAIDMGENIRAKQCEIIFPELKESEGEDIRKDIISNLKRYVNCIKDGYDAPSAKDFVIKEIEKQIAWLEKQSNNPVTIDIDVESMVSSYKQRLKSQTGIRMENNPLINMPLIAFRHGVENTLEELNLKKLEKQDEQKPFDFEKKELKKIDNEIEIPFGAKDSELQEATYYIPKGFHAEIDDDKVVIKKGEKSTVWSEDDEHIRKRLINLVNEVYDNTNYITFLEHKELLTWLEKLDDNVEL
ncbi:MAG: hypothetical protein ABS939_19745 [Psychrobacillus sp.]